MQSSRDMGPEHTANWPKSRRVADTFPVELVVVYTIGHGFAVAKADSAEAADTLAVEYQRKGHRAWVVTLEDDGLGQGWDE